MFKLHVNSRKNKVLAWFMIFSLLQEIFMPLTAFALTGGPSQPEVESFEPAGTTEMVDNFSGDFNYNIPLLTVGNYPVNLAYHGGVGMDDEASWVGLGWNINVGTINRQKRGLPDDFNENDFVKRTTSMRPNRTVSLDIGKLFQKKRELVGKKINAKINASDNFKWLLGKKLPTPNYYYNNYKGLGISYSLAKFEMGPFKVGVGYDNQSGMSISPSLSFSKVLKTSHSYIDEGWGSSSLSFSASISCKYNSRSGLSALSFGFSRLKSKEANRIIKDGYNFDIECNSSLTGSLGSSSSISFVNPTSTPIVSPSMYSGSYNFELTIGQESKFKLKGKRLAGSYSVQGIKETNQQFKPIGYLYAEKQNQFEDGIYDINRENDQGLSRYTNNLAIPNQTYDVYSVSGQGISGMFRPHRNSVGILSDAKAKISERPINGASLGIEIGSNPSGDVKVGADIGINFNYGFSGPWDSKDIHGSAGLEFCKWNIATPNQEPFYFKRAGELTQADDSYFDKLGKTNAMRLRLVTTFEKYNMLFDKTLDQFAWSETLNKLIPVSSTNAATDALKRVVRDKRSTPYSHLTADEAQNYALVNVIENYIENNPDSWSDNTNNQFTQNDLVEVIPRKGEYRQGNHLSEITSVNVDGTRYVYGIPAYNIITKDVSFNVSGNTVNIDRGHVDFSAGVDNSINNKKGLNRLYSSEEVSSYAHSYLLTAVLSSNYSD